jgi:ABC-2 type transport system ATP-binding protein
MNDTALPEATSDGIRSTPAMAAVAVEGLVKHYGRVVAVDDISFTVARGSITGLLGGNGAGKTTTIAMLLGLVLPDAGRIEILGSDMATDAASVRPRMNFESPYVDMPLRLTVRQNLTVYGRLYAVAGLADRIAGIADALSLTELLDRPTGRLSAGQKTRASLAKALINRPAILLLDEPTASLDPDTADWVRGHLERFRRDDDATILLASHNMGEVERMCDRVLMMKEGRIVDDGSPADLIRAYGRDTMEEVFLDVARGRKARVS